MDEKDLRALVGRVKDGSLSRRAFLEVMVGVGLSGPFAAQILMHSGVASAGVRPGLAHLRVGERRMARLQARALAFHRLHRAAESEMDPIKRAAMYVQMNDLAVGGGHIIPLVMRPGVAAVSRRMRLVLSPWTTAFWALPDWYRQA